AADLRGQYERLREQYGFRVLDYSIDADTASPRACFQFSEELPARTDFAPFIVVAGVDKPALSAAEKQLCVEGLKHGDTYSVTLPCPRRCPGGGFFPSPCAPASRWPVLPAMPTCCRARASAEFPLSASTAARSPWRSCVSTTAT